MSDHHTIAVVPSPEWREALLADGPCNSVAPWVSLYDGAWRVIGASAADNERAGFPTALPLLWRGEPVPDGIARAVRALIEAEADRAVINGVFPSRMSRPSLSDLIDAHRDMARNAMGPHPSFNLRALAHGMAEASIASEVIEVRDAD